MSTKKRPDAAKYVAEYFEKHLPAAPGIEDHTSIIGLIDAFDVGSVLAVCRQQDFTMELIANYPGVKCVTEIDSSEHCKVHGAEGRWDMVYIDPSHSYDDTIKDTELALALKPRIIVWHDYISPRRPAPPCPPPPTSVGEAVRRVAEAAGLVVKCAPLIVGYAEFKEAKDE